MDNFFSVILCIGGVFQYKSLSYPLLLNGFFIIKCIFSSVTLIHKQNKKARNRGKSNKNNESTHYYPMQINKQNIVSKTNRIEFSIDIYGEIDAYVHV